MEQQPLLIEGKKAKAILCMLKTNVHDHSIYRVKLDDPTTVLVDLFKQIGLPITILDSLELEEFYMGYI